MGFPDEGGLQGKAEAALCMARPRKEIPLRRNPGIVARTAFKRG